MKITAIELKALGRFRDCCEDSAAGGHDVPKEMMQRLAAVGVVRTLGFGRHETTEFGDWLLAQPPEVKVPPMAVPHSWTLVPAEPDGAMQAAGAQAIRIDTTAINKIWTGNAVFRAMIAAAPIAPAHGAAEQGDALNSALQRAASELPDGYTITVEVECGYGGVSWCNPAGEQCDEYHSDLLAEDVIDALEDAKQDAAIAAGALPSIESEAA